MGMALFSVAVLFALLLLSAFTVIPVLAFRREPKFRDEYSLTFSPSGIHFRTSKINSDIQWALYSWALIDAQSYVLYYGKESFTIVPKRVFDSSSQRDAFEKLLAEKIPRLVNKQEVKS
jgi:YcxB-like protein